MITLLQQQDGVVKNQPLHRMNFLEAGEIKLLKGLTLVVEQVGERPTMNGMLVMITMIMIGEVLLQDLKDHKMKTEEEVEVVEEAEVMELVAVKEV
jgi:hypothetical protein